MTDSTLMDINTFKEASSVLFNIDEAKKRIKVVSSGGLFLKSAFREFDKGSLEVAKESVISHLEDELSALESKLKSL